MTGGCVLVTRPEAEASATAVRLTAMGFTPLVSPVLTITPRRLRLRTAAGLQAILITSGNAIAALPAWLHGIPVFCVGDASAARARLAGFTTVASAGQDADALIALVGAQCCPEGGPLLLPVGAGQGRGVAAGLQSKHFRVLRRVAYAARPESSLPPAARLALAERRVAAALFFSPASARAFVCACGSEIAVSGVRAVAISAATAAALAPLRWADIRVASRPNQDELLECLM